MMLFDHAPAYRFEGGVDQLGARFGLVHAAIAPLSMSRPEKAL
jgi:hypothetical protein